MPESGERTAVDRGHLRDRDAQRIDAMVSDETWRRDADRQGDSTVAVDGDLRLANDFDNTVIHALFGTTLRLHSLMPRTSEGVRAELLELIGEIDGVIREMRDVDVALAPGALLPGALLPAAGPVARNGQIPEQLHAVTDDDWALAAQDRRLAAADRRQAAQYLADAYRDEVTGALHRRPGRQRIKAEIDRARRTSTPLEVIFLDVDGLKRVNDTHGHGRGDELLAATGMALRNGLRSYDVIVRYGGDEFVCALPGGTSATASASIDRIRRTLADLVPGATVSAGRARLLPDETMDELIRRADSDLYRRRQRPGKEA